MGETLMAFRSAIILLACVFSVFSREIITSVTCEVSGDCDYLRETAMKLISLKVNEPLDTVLLNQSLEALKVCRLFEQVDYERSSGEVKFLLTPAVYVRDIRIKREIPLFEDDVERAMSTYPGDIYTEEMMKVQDSLITALYQREGFISPYVEVSSYQHRSGTDKVLTVKIKAGPFYRLNSLDIRGNNSVSDFRIKRSMRLWRTSLLPGIAGRFVETVLQDDIKGLLELYKSKGFADVQIRDTVITDSLTKLVQVILDIDEGYRYRVKISSEGNRAFRKRTLRKDVTIHKTGNRNNAGVRKSVKAMEKRLANAGFLGAGVEIADTVIQKRKHKRKEVYFSVKAGKRTTVSSIIIKGARRLDEKTIRGQMLHVDKGRDSKRAYNPERLQEDIFAIQTLYRSRGFLSASVNHKVEQSENMVSIVISIDEGKRTFIGDVSVDFSRFPCLDTGKAITVRKGDPFRSDLLKRGAHSLQTIIAEKGYPHAVVTPVVSLSEDSSRADVEFSIEEGPLVTMGDIRYIGAFRTRRRVLERESMVRSGEPLSLKDIVDTQKRVRDLGLFSSIRFRTIGLREKRDTVHMFVEVAEKRSIYGALDGGYQSDKRTFLNAKVGDRNLFGFNREAWVRGEVSQLDSLVRGGSVDEIDCRGEMGISDPRLFGTKTRATVQFYGERESQLNQSWKSVAGGVSGGLTFIPSKDVMLGLGAGYERRKLFQDIGGVQVDTAGIPEELRPRNTVSLKPSFAWDRRDSFTRPRKGMFISSVAELSKSIGSTVDNFLKAQVEGRGYLSPFSFLTFAGVVRGGYLKPWGGAKETPADRRFYLGGTGDVRGFDENLLNQDDTTGGYSSLSASIEARLDVGFNLELAAFADVGRLEDQLVSITPEQFRYSAGVGIRYVTPIGPIGFLYGWKIGRREGESPGKLHFSLGYTF